jgi:hypothetical protein
VASPTFVQSERRYFEDLELLQVRSAIQLRSWGWCYCRYMSTYLPLSPEPKRYMRTLVNRSTIDQDTVRGFFPGLNKFLNFQRNFLLDCEAQYNLPSEAQRWGKCFIVNIYDLNRCLRHPHLSRRIQEAYFAVHEALCANYPSPMESSKKTNPLLLKDGSTSML